jgi:hypothetical protein
VLLPFAAHISFYSYRYSPGFLPIASAPHRRWVEALSSVLTPFCPGGQEGMSLPNGLAVDGVNRV